MSEHSLIYDSDVTRARPLPADERRQALIEATLPLLREQGLGVSTRQIAEAAGVAEGTIFRVFESKDDLVNACLVEALSAHHVTRQIANANRATVEETVTALFETLQRHFADIHSLMLLHHPTTQAPGPHGQGAHPTGGRCQRPDFDALRGQVSTAVADVLTLHTDELSTTPSEAAALILIVGTGAHHPVATDHTLSDPHRLAHLIVGGLSQEA